VLRRWHSGNPPAVVKEEKRLQVELGEQVFRQHLASGRLLANVIPLEAICYISEGMALQADEKRFTGSFRKDDLISSVRDKSHPVAYVEGKDIDPYEVTRLRFLEYGENLRAPSLVRRPTFSELYTVTKIIAQRSVPRAFRRLEVLLDRGELEGALYANNSTVILVPWAILKGVVNRSLNHEKRDEYEEMSRRFDIRFLAGLLNSAWMGECMTATRRHNIHVFADDYRAMPVPDVAPDEQGPITERVERL
jgi:hypothetical protein